jgi:hypothetical protein
MRVNVAPCRLLRSCSRTSFRFLVGSRLVGRRCPGCIAPRSCAPAAVVLPSVVVEVVSPLGLEVVIPLETTTILGPPLLDLQVPAF